MSPHNRTATYSCAKGRTWTVGCSLTAHATTLHCHLERSEGPGCLLFTSPPAQPLTIVFLSEAKDLDCWLFPHCPHNHTPLSCCAKRRTWTVGCSLTAHLTTRHCHPARSEGPGLLAVPSLRTQPHSIVILREAKDLGFRCCSFRINPNTP